MSNAAFVGSQAFNQLSSIQEDVIPNTGSLILNIPIINLMGKVNGIDLNLNLTYMLGKESRFGLPDSWSFGLAFLSPGKFLDVNGSRYIIDPNWKDTSGYASGLKYQNNHGIKFTDNVTSQPLPYVSSGSTYQFTYQELDGSTSYFSSQGYLLMKADRFGNYLYYAYTTSNLIDHIVDSFDQKTSFGYNPNEIIITYPDGRQTSIQYSSTGVSSVEDPLGQKVVITPIQQGNFSVVSSITYPSGKKTQVLYHSLNFKDTSGNTGALPVVSDLQYFDNTGTLLMHNQYAYGTNSGGNTFTGYSSGFSLSSSTDGLLESNNTLYQYDVQVSQLDSNGTILSLIDTFYSFAHVPVQKKTYIYDNKGTQNGYFQLDSSYDISPDKHNQRPNYLCPKETEQSFIQSASQPAAKHKKITMAYDDFGNTTEKTVSLFDEGQSSYVLHTKELATYFTQSGLKIASLISTFDKCDCITNRVIRTTNTLASDLQHIKTSSLSVSEDGGTNWDSWKQISQRYDEFGREITTSVQWLKTGMPGVQQTKKSYSYAYDSTNLCVVTSFTDPLGYTSKVKTSTMFGARLEVTSSSGNSTSYTYDKLGRLVSKTLPSGLKSTQTYKSMSADGENSTTITSATSYYTKTVFDALSREIAKYDNGDPTAPTTQRQLSSKQYDTIGNIIQESNVYGNETTCQYNSLGKLLVSVDSYQNKTEMVYDHGANTTSTTINGVSAAFLCHDHNGRIIQQDRLPNLKNGDATSQYTVRTEFTYAGYGNVLTKTINKVNSSTTTLTANRYQYNADSKCINEEFSAEDGSGSKTTFTFDINSKQVSHAVTRTYDSGNSFTTNSEVNGYDALGQKVSVTNNQGQSERFTFNGDGLLVTKTLFDGSTTDLTYSADGQVTSEVWNNGSSQTTVTFDYDNAGRMISVTDTSDSLAYEYAADGSLKTITYPDGKVVTFTLDKYSRKVAQTDASGFVTKYAYNAQNQLSSVTTPNDTLNYTYYQDVSQNTNFGAPESVELKNVYTETYAYDGFNRRNSLQRVASQGGDVMLSETNTFSPINQLLSTSLSSEMSSSKSLNHSRTFTYDGFCQLTLDTITDSGNKLVSKRSYAYDANMNIVAKTDTDGTETKYSYNNIEQLTSYTVGTGSPQQQTYDQNGKLLVDGDGRKYTYDTQGFLVSVETSGGKQEYAYYPNKTLASRTSGAGSTTMYYDNSQQVLTTYEGATPTQFLTVGSKRFASYVDAQSTKYYGTNQRQDTVSITSGGKITSEASYESYGASDGTLDLSASESFGWNQEYSDVENDLVYLRSRYYDPKTMRFITRDAKQVSNRYAYGNGDPINNVDPTGHDAESWAIFGVGAGLGLGATYIAITYGASLYATASAFFATASAAVGAVGGAGTVASIATGTVASYTATALGVGPLGTALLSGVSTFGTAAAVDTSIGSAVGATVGQALGAYIGGSVIGGETATMLGSAAGGLAGGYVGTAVGQALGFGETTVAASFSAAADMLGTAAATATASVTAVGDAIGTAATATAAATTATAAAVGDAVGAVTATAATVTTAATEAAGAAASMAADAVIAAGAAVGIETAGDAAAVGLIALLGLAFL